MGFTIFVLDAHSQPAAGALLPAASLFESLPPAASSSKLLFLAGGFFMVLILPLTGHLHLWDPREREIAPRKGVSEQLLVVASPLFW